MKARDVRKLTGQSYRTLDYWTRCGYLTPVNQAPGHGNEREYPPGEVDVAVSMARLVAAGVTPEAAHGIARGDEKAIAQLGAALERVLL